MKKYNVYVVLLITMFSIDSYADDKYFLTVDELVSSGYRAISGEQISALMESKTIKVIDVETDAVIVSKQGESDAAMDRKFVTEKSAKAPSLFDARLMARAPALDGKIKREIVGDELVSTDGARTYRFRLYEKQGRIFAVRDIDHGNVFFEVK